MGKISKLLLDVGVAAVFYFGATYVMDVYFSAKQKAPDNATMSTLEKIASDVSNTADSAKRRISKFVDDAKSIEEYYFEKK